MIVEGTRVLQGQHLAMDVVPVPHVEHTELRREGSFPALVVAVGIEMADIGDAWSGWSCLAEGKDIPQMRQREHASELGSVGTLLAMVPACHSVIVHPERRLMVVTLEEVRFVFGRHWVADRGIAAGRQHVETREDTPDD